MPRITYEDWNPRGDAWSMVQSANQIAATYSAQGYDLTLRQLYYQFVSRDLLPNNQKSYDKLGIIVNRARLAGLMDWDYIVDRTRNLESISHWDKPADVVAAAARSFRLDKWTDQPTRVEVWVEKEALAGVIERAAARTDCAWFSCRGYVSQSEMWGAGQRIGSYIQNGQNVVILHLGDHDPSGIDMTRDIEDRLKKFIAVDLNDGDYEIFNDDYRTPDDWLEDYGYNNLDERSPLEIHRIALNFSQIQQYAPPPNPAKVTDSRADKYIQRFGTESWELDALEPAVLDQLIEDSIAQYLDPERYDNRVTEETTHRDLLNRISAQYEGVVARLEEAS